MENFTSQAAGNSIRWRKLLLVGGYRIKTPTTQSTPKQREQHAPRGDTRTAGPTKRQVSPSSPRGQSTIAQQTPHDNNRRHEGTPSRYSVTTCEKVFGLVMWHKCPPGNPCQKRGTNERQQQPPNGTERRARIGWWFYDAKTKARLGVEAPFCSILL